MTRQPKIVPASLHRSLVQPQGRKEMLSMAFSGGAAGPELYLGLVRRKRSEVGSLKRDLREPPGSFPRSRFVPAYRGYSQY